MQIKNGSFVLLTISVLFLATQPAYCQVKNYKCVEKYPSLSKSQQDSAIISVSIDINNKTIEINEPTPIHFNILRIKKDYVNDTKKITVYKVREENGKRGEVAVIANYPNENMGAPILVYSPPRNLIGRKKAKIYQPRVWCLASI